MNEPTDYPEEDTEEVILTRWEKLKNWADIFKTTFTIGKIIWGLLFVSAGAVVVGEVTDTTPVRDAAVAVGVLGEKPPLTIDELWVKVMELEEEVEVLSLPHQHNYPDAEVIVGPPGKNGKDGKDGTAGPPGAARL